MPDQTPEAIEALVKDYLTKEFTKLGSKNTLNIEMLHGGKAWVASLDHYNYRAAIKATEVSIQLITSRYYILSSHARLSITEHLI